MIRFRPPRSSTLRTFPGVDRRPTQGETELQRVQLELQSTELEVREKEAAANLAKLSRPWWRGSDPLVLAIIGASLTMLGNIAVALFNSRATIAQEKLKAENELELDKRKAKYNLILQAMATNDSALAQRNVNFFISAGLLEDPNKQIRTALDKFNPVLPSAVVAGPALPLSRLARLYNFPLEQDGSGQKVGILEFGGSYNLRDLDDYFAAARIHRPSVTDVLVDGGIQKQDGAEGQVTLDIEIIGTLAPKADLRVYFGGSFNAQTWDHSIRHAISDGVSVLCIGWGSAESEWSPQDLALVNASLEAAATAGVTVVAAMGDDGASDQVDDGRPHVDFPASSPWVLGVGGTSMETSGDSIVEESAWSEGDGTRKGGGGSTGGGVSDVFELPAWQQGTNVPLRRDGHAGRGSPDVAAVASPGAVLIQVAGSVQAIGGTSISAPIWAGLVALINQGLGHNLGYFNPRLYTRIGPAGILRPVLKGNNSVGKVKGYQAGPGWNAVSGWGTPDGKALLEWLRSHP